MGLLYLVFQVAVMIGTAYCVAMILIGFPVSAWEYLTKRKVNKEKEEKVIKCVTTLLSVIFILRLLYEIV